MSEISSSPARGSVPAIIRGAIDGHRLIPGGVHVVVAVSGGADSIALLHALHGLGLPLHIAHLNHQLRGADSDADEAFVRRRAAELNLPITVKSADVKARTSSGLSIEMAARQARHAFFSEFDNAVIALAHHADDQVETFLLKLARGAGTEGLSGMAHRETIGAIRLIRPMLDLRRREILQWLKDHDIRWREDASNSDATFLRNRVRHTVLPLLERELNPGIRENILRTMDILRAQNEFVDEASSRAPYHETRLEASSILKQPLAIRRRLIQKWLYDNDVENVSFHAIDGILALLQDGKGTAIFELNRRQRVVVEYGIPRFESDPEQTAPPKWSLTAEPGTGWKKDSAAAIGSLPAEASFDAEKVGNSPVEVRAWQPGDRIAPLGMEGSRKLQDIFTDRKIPSAQRSRLPVVVCRGEIIWLPGYRIARDWAVRGKHGNSVHVRLVPHHTD